MDSLRAYGVLAAALLGAAFVAPRSLAGVPGPPPLVVSSAADAGAGSLRQAIIDANMTAGADNITFNIPGSGVHRISLRTALPYIDEAVTIDGSTQLGYSGTPLIELSGTSVTDDSGLVVRTNSVKIRALSIINFGHHGVAVVGNGAYNNFVEANYIGVEASGTVAEGNGTAAGLQYGVTVTGGAGATTIQNNLISGNPDGGVTIDGGTSSKIVNNRIGTDRTGAGRVPNGNQGVLIQGQSDSTSIRNNLISGNDGHGIHLYETGDNFILGNIIGTNVACDQALENQGVGIYLTDDAAVTSSNYIGSPFTGDGNLISGNRRDGIRIEGSGVSGTVVQSNRIGTDGTGTAIIANGDGGVAIINSSNHQIGGPDLIAHRVGPSSGARTSSTGRFGASDSPPVVNLGVANLLSGNGADGVFIFGPESAANLVSENRIGTTLSGSLPLANNAAGVTIRGSENNVVSLNTISGNATGGVRLEDTAISNQILENFIGTNPTGNVQVGGNGAGVLLQNNSNDTTIYGNVISGNGSDGISLLSGAHDNIIRSNRIGTNVNGAAAIPNNGHGIRIESPDNEIGAGDGDGNLISGNRLDGVYLSTSGATGNELDSNRIGTDATAEGAIPNERHGVSIGAGASNNTVSTGSFTANTIANNAQTGVSVTGGSGNTIRGNSIYDNGRLGIDLNEDAITFNDAGDLDMGPNGLQNFPVLTEVTGSIDTVDLTISGTLDSLPNHTYTIDFYNNPTPDPSGYGEGQRYFDSTSVTTDSAGHAEFTYTTSRTIDPGTGISATATDSDGSTSEFSANLGYGVDLTPPLFSACSVTPRSLPGTGGTVTFSANVTDNVGVDVVRVNVTRPDTTTTTVMLMREGTSDTFSGTFNVPANTGTAPQQYQVKFEAFDAATNRATMDCGVFTVAVSDTTPPTIVNCTADPRTLSAMGGYVHFQADITDASGVMTARVVVTNPDATETVVPLNRFEVGDTYAFDYQFMGNSGNSPLVYGIRFEAVDTVGNQTVEPCGTVTVEIPDRTGPTIVNCDVIPRSLPAAGGPVQIRADITDPSGLATTNAFITFPDTSVTQITLTMQGESNTYAGTFNAPSNGSPTARTYAVKIGATDSLRNGSSMDCGSFTVGGADTDPPMILNCDVTPTVLPPAGGTVTLGADVTDNFGVRTVQGRISRPDGTVAVVPLTPTTGNHYTGTFTAPANTATADQTYTVFVTATDDGGNTAIMRCGTFTVQAPDTQSPGIKSCQVQPRRLPSPGGDFTILATVTDNRGVASVTATVVGPSGTTNVTLAPTGGGNYSGTFTAPANLGAQDVNYQVTLNAVDTSGNTATMDCGTATVLKPDTEPPVIVSCDVLPRTLRSPGGNVTLRANVTDNAGVDRVEATITGADEFGATVTLTLTSGTTYEATWQAPDNDTESPQVFQVAYRAVDTSGNEATADCGTVTVAVPDNQAPVIGTCQVTPRALLAGGGAVTITANVTDDVAVSGVQAVITRPDGSQATVVLTAQGGNNYQGTFAVSPNTGANPQVYQVEIRAQDNSDNQSSVDCGTFTVAIPDTTAPVLINCAVTPRALPSAGGAVIVTADATDNVSVQSVVAEITRPDGTVATVQLSSTGGSGYTGTIDLPANETNAIRIYRIRLIATDPTGNRTTEECGAVTVAAVDRQAPVIASCSLSPTTLPFTGGNVQVQASVSDNVGVASVTARILRDGVLIDTVELMAVTATDYAARFAALPNFTGTAQEYTVELTATDTAGNSRTVGCGTYTVSVDTVQPTLVACDATPRTLGSEGGLVTFTATVTDAIRLDHVAVRILRPDGSLLRVVTLESIGDDQFRGTWTAPANNGSTALIYSLVVEAVDVAGNIRQTDCGVVTVALASGGSAQVSVKNIAFGRVRFGTRVRRQFVIRNVSGAARLAVNLSTLELPFTVRLEGTGLDGAASAAAAKKTKEVIAAAPGTASSFSIGPGGIVTVFVEFSPPAIRNYSDRLLINTSDTRHPEFRIRVTGVGCRNGRRGTPINTDDGGSPGGAAPVQRKQR